MLVSYKWLNEFLDLSAITATELADKMSRTGIEVEEVNQPSAGLKKIVVGDVKECVPHPDSDHLSVCQVDVGEEELFQIVCGAPNIKAGKKVIVALPNSRIVDNVKIKKGKIRGQVSLGMICSLDELGFSENVIAKEYSDGIFFLPDEAVPGEEVFPYLEMDDEIIELSITPNRADALSLRGVAHEVGAIYRQTPSFAEKELTEDSTGKISDYLTVSVANEGEVPNYRMRVVEGVTIKESPLWLQSRLMNAGIRPISNVVDVTNYVLLLFGQPMHAFDYHAIGSKEILVRRAEPGEKLTTLDGHERDLTNENIVITNGTTPIGLAGVMGGLDSEITNATTTVALEAATFNPLLIRKTAKQFGLRSESSSRFEKGTNLSTVQAACDYAAALIAELSGGQVVSGELVASEKVGQAVEVSVTLAHLNKSLGTELSHDTVAEIFTTLGFTFVTEDDLFTVTVPPRRWDIKIPADLVEEVARIYGYDDLPSTLPSGEALPGALTTNQQMMRRIKASLEGNGLSEVISYALTTPKKATDFSLDSGEVVPLQSPMSEDHSVLRQSLTSGLLDDVAYNVARKNNNLALYETGNIFIAKGKNEMPVEKRHLGIALTGLWEDNSWQGDKVPVDYFLLKGILENLFDQLGAKELVRFVATDSYSELHPGRTAQIMLGEKVLGFVGQVHPQTAKDYDLPETYVAELDLTCLFDAELVKTNFASVAKFPSMKRDIALLVKAEVSNQAILDVIYKNGTAYLEKVSLFDLYEGEKLGADKKSLAYSLTFLNPEATLVDDEVNHAMSKVQNALETELGAEIR